MPKWAVLVGTVSVLGLTAPAALAQDVVDGAGTDEIVVNAIRQSLETSQSIKQDSDEIVDSVVAEDIGKLPDVTAAESLARITGVQVDRTQGEASNTRVRGLPDLTTTYNGREIFTAEGRSVALQDFPAAGIARLDVYKSGSANLIEAGIAGLIDVRSRKPLDFKGDRIAGGVTGVHWYQSQKIGLDANLLVSRRWSTGIGEIGFLIEGSYADVNFQDSSRNVSQTISNRTGVPGTTGAIRYPSFVNVDYTNAERFRPSAAAAFQWRPSPELEIYFDGLFQGYRTQNAGRNMQFGVGDLATLSNIEFIPDTNQVRRFDVTGGQVPSGTQNAVEAQTDTYQAGGGFIWKQDRLRVTGDVAFTDSTFTNRNFSFNFQTRAAPDRRFDFDTDQGVGGGTVTLSSYNLFDPANYRLTAINQTGNRGHGRDVQARLDLQYSLGSQGITSLQTGVRFNNRDAEAFNYNVGRNAPANQFYTVLPLDYASATPGFRNDEADSVRTFLTPTRDSLVAQADYLRALVGAPEGRPEFADPIYRGNERGYAGYVQARYALEVGGVPIDGLVGVRAVRTENSLSGTVRSTTGGVTTITPVTRDNAYNDVLPNISARLRFSRELQLRLAFTETRSRPGFGQLNPSLTINAPSGGCSSTPLGDCFRSASVGNPDLQPVQSRNFDTSLEWYFSRSGSLTIGAFHRDVVGFISNFTIEEQDPQLGLLRITRPGNGGEGQLRGVEIGFRTFLRASWLPEWVSDFGVLANYTYIDHETELAEQLAVTRPGPQRIAGVSSHLANGSIFYENRWFSTRLSYNYRSNFVVSYGQVADPSIGNALGPTLPVIEDGRGTLDLNGTLNPRPDITISFGITNLLGAAATNQRAFNDQGQSYPWQTRFLESVYRLGVRFRI